MDAFEELEHTIRSRGPDAAFELLAAKARQSGEYREVFRVRSMQARRRFGMPLIETEAASEPPPGTIHTVVNIEQLKLTGGEREIVIKACNAVYMAMTAKPTR